jgi:hypothetical protein
MVTSCALSGKGYSRAHGVFMALTDDGHHTVRQCTLAGKVLLTLAIPASRRRS